MENKKAKVLFLGNSNSSRSIMAEAFVRHYAADRFEPHSAGLAPAGIHPMTARVMGEAGIPLDGQVSTNVLDYLGQVHFGYLVTVCSHAEANCPRALVGISKRLFWDIEDPDKFVGDEESTYLKYQQIRDQIAGKVQQWVADPAAGAA